MGKGLFLAGVLVGAVALLWAFLLLGLFSQVTVGGSPAFLLLPLVVFGAGGASVAGGIVGHRWVTGGAVILFAAGLAGLSIPVALLLLNPRVDVTFLEGFFASFVVSWWAYFLLLVGGLTILNTRRPAPAS